MRGQRIHSITQADDQRRVGVCAVCGPVGIIGNGNRRKDGSPVWRCKQAHKVYKKSKGTYNGSGRHNRKVYRLLVTADSVCSACGFVPKHPSQLDVHRHRDPDPEILCANCHRLETARENGIYED